MTRLPRPHETAQPLGPDLDTGLGPDLDTGLDTGLGPDLDPGSDPGLDTGLGPDLDPDLDTGLGPDLDAGSDPAGSADPADPDTLTGNTPRAPRAPRTRHLWRGQAPVIGAVAVGGALGASARYGAALLWPRPPGGFPWATLWVNVAGCAVIGVFLVLVTEAWSAHPLVRPFFGTGVLGGFTTFSAYAVDIQRLLETRHAATGLAYLGLTLLAAMTAVWTAVLLTRRTIAWRQR